jgi:cation diffusion facilitator CzcD-associated flavoprotein CzcO
MTDEENIRKSSLQLKFIIVGAGIGGLATAYALARAGHNVRVLELYHSLGQVWLYLCAHSIALTHFTEIGWYSYPPKLVKDPHRMGSLRPTR